MRFVLKLLFFAGFVGLLGVEECFPTTAQRGRLYLVAERESDDLEKAKNAAFQWLIAARKQLEGKANVLLINARSKLSGEELVLATHNFTKTINFFSLQHIHMLHKFETVAEVEGFLDQCVAAFVERNDLLDRMIADDSAEFLSPIEEERDSISSKAAKSYGPVVSPEESASDSLISYICSDWWFDPDLPAEEHRKVVLKEVAKIMHFLEKIPEKRNQKMIDGIPFHTRNYILQISPGWWFTTERQVILKLQKLLGKE